MERIEVEVAYALPQRQLITKVTVAAGTTAAEAIDLSGIRRIFPGIEEQPMVGIFSRKVGLEYQVQAGDRVEIYRPLLADPKEIRRRKAEEQKAEKQKTGAKQELKRLRQH